MKKKAGQKMASSLEPNGKMFLPLGNAQNVGDQIVMLADGSAAWSKAAGLDWDLDGLGLGVRSQRYAMIVDDGTVSHIAVEQGGAFDVSSGESILAAL